MHLPMQGLKVTSSVTHAFEKWEVGFPQNAFEYGETLREKERTPPRETPWAELAAKTV